MYTRQLAINNAHPRDAQIRFYEEGHKYEILNDIKSKYISVTTWNHSHFPKFDADSVIKNMMKGKNWNQQNKYWGQTPEEIKSGWTKNGTEASGTGTDLHYEIECFMNNEELKANYTHKDLLDHYYSQTSQSIRNTDEWQHFIQFIKDHPELKPYRTEWLVYNEDFKLAGSIDMVYENPDGTLSIYDWKRAKDISAVNSFNKYAITECISHFPDANFWHYSLQLNTYKTILEQKYNKKIKELFLVRLHPNADNYELRQVPILLQEMKDLFKLINSWK
jgi:ATP-dependent exoDNAse (exonuclease V) beta subunit